MLQQVRNSKLLLVSFMMCILCSGAILAFNMLKKNYVVIEKTEIENTEQKESKEQFEFKEDFSPSALTLSLSIPSLSYGLSQSHLMYFSQHYLDISSPPPEFHS
jgi:hypothetical protein